MSLKIGIIVGSVREARNGLAVGNWTLQQALGRKDANVSYELVDLKDYPLPFLGITPTESEGKTIAAWSSKIESLDGFVMVVPEYNHALSGAFKNALDYLKPQFANKPVGYVGYGGLGAARAIETSRMVAIEQGMPIVPKTVNFLLAVDFVNYSEFKPTDYHLGEAKEMFDTLVGWTEIFKAYRAKR